MPGGGAVYGRLPRPGKPGTACSSEGVERSNLLPGMRFFFLEDPPPEAGTRWRPPRLLARHLAALRLAPGEAVLLLPPRGEAVEATLAEDGVLEVGAARPRPELPLADVVLATAWPKGPRADDLVVRATEAGVRAIVPLQCARSVAGRGELPAAKRERWERLMRETCQQCRNPRLPELTAQPLTPAEALDAYPGARPVALLPGTWPLAMELELHPSPSWLLLVGPEGGFDDAEEALFRERGVSCAGLLPTILRIEAAGPAAVTLVQHHALARRGH